VYLNVSVAAFRPGIQASAAQAVGHQKRYSGGAIRTKLPAYDWLAVCEYVWYIYIYKEDGVLYRNVERAKQGWMDFWLIEAIE